MPAYKVIYFDLPARGEPLRLAFAIGGIAFEDKKVTFEEWPTMQPTLAPLQLPLLEVDGKTVSQSAAQLRYACKLAKFDGKPLYPEDPFEAILVDEMCDMAYELLPGLGPLYDIADPKARAEAEAALVKVGGPAEKWAAHIDSLLGKSKTGFAVCDRFTMADILIFCFLSIFRMGYCEGMPKDCFDHLKNVCKHKDMISAIPQVKKYYKDATGLKAYLK